MDPPWIDGPWWWFEDDPREQPMTEHERISMILIAAAKLSQQVFQMRDNWAESSPGTKAELWRNLHEANTLYHRVTNHPDDFVLTIEEKLRP